MSRGLTTGSSHVTNGRRSIGRRTIACLSGVVLATALAGFLSACDHSPSAPSAPSTVTPPPATPAPTGPSIVSLRISGPATIAPRGRGVSVAQFTATATRVDGSSADVTATAKWNASRYAIVHPSGARPGEMQGEGRGEAVIEASAGGINAELPVFVLEEGTFKVAGAITDGVTREGLEGVKVRIESGTGAGLTSLSDRFGKYALYGAAASSVVVASVNGFTSQAHAIVLDAATTVDFALVPNPFDLNLTGSWTLQISASPGCRDRLPVIARDRQYDAAITQRSARVTITLLGPTISGIGGPMGEFEALGTLDGDVLSFAISGDTGYGDYTSVDFSDQLGPTESMGIAASAQGTLTGSEIRAAMSGDIEYWARATPAGRPAVVCRASDHVAILRRK
jgi:hypothetical protein